MLSPGGGQRRENFSQCRQFFARCVWQKKKVCRSQVRGAPPKFTGWCGPDLTRSGHPIREVPNSGCGDVSRDLSIGPEPDGCDFARIKLHYGKSNPDGKWRAGLSGLVRVQKCRVSPHRTKSDVLPVASHCVINLTILIPHYISMLPGI